MSGRGWTNGDHLPLSLQTADDQRTSAEGVKLVRVYVWDKVVRICHWTIALSITVLAVTGFYIGSPFISAPGEAGQRFVMGWIRGIHFYAATGFSVAVLARVYWSFLGSPPARWPNFIPTSRRRYAHMKRTLAYYLLMANRFPGSLSHNPLAGIAYSLIVCVYALMMLTGIGLYAIGAHVSSPLALFSWIVPLFGGPQVARLLHHVGMWVIIIFVVQHLYSAVLAAHIEKNGILESIFTGYKWIEPDALEVEEVRPPKAPRS